MSQQRVLFAVCLFSGLVALAQCQGTNFNPQQCISSVQGSMSTFQQQAGQSMQTLTSQLSKRGVDAANFDDIRVEVDSMISEYTSMLNFSNGVDPQALMQSAAKMGRLYSSLVLKTIRISVVTGAFSEYAQFLSSMGDAQTTMMQGMVSGCIPSRRYTLPQ